MTGPRVVGGLGASRVVRFVAVVPAAGASRRMGRAKLLMPWGEGEGAAGTVAGALISALWIGGAEEVALVLAPQDGSERGRAAAELVVWARQVRSREATDRGLSVTTNPAPERGMLSSIRCGLEALGGAAALAKSGTALLVTPADLPALQASTVIAVNNALRMGAALAVPTDRGRRGHPLGLAPHLIPEIDHLDLDQGLRQLLDRHAPDLVEIPVDDPGAIHDIDTPADYQDLTRLARPKHEG